MFVATLLLWGLTPTNGDRVIYSNWEYIGSHDGETQLASKKSIRSKGETDVGTRKKLTAGISMHYHWSGFSSS